MSGLVFAVYNRSMQVERQQYSAVKTTLKPRTDGTIAQLDTMKDLEYGEDTIEWDVTMVKVLAREI